MAPGDRGHAIFGGARLPISVPGLGFLRDEDFDQTFRRLPGSQQCADRL